MVERGIAGVRRNFRPLGISEFTAMKGIYSRTRVRRTLLAAIMLAVASTSATAQTTIATGVFPKVESIETQLKRGVSTKADVQRVIGIPNGTGGALLPGYGERSLQVEPYQVWYYDDMEIVDATSEENVLKLKMRWQFLVVFFRGEMFHGYFWSRSREPMVAQ